ncbi:MAG: tyrosine protein phosphatase, partial [Candidatus Omnitrophica bacterium]|nr:tyrosine protein phosphatase [Candidatus Omnitrophota bacterium]
MQESLEMARIAVADGIKTIIATPHHNSPYVDSQPAAVVLNRVEELREELRRHAIPLEILPGQEIHITETIVE